MKDMTGKDDQFRGPAIRALCSITDVSFPAYWEAGTSRMMYMYQIYADYI